MAWGVGLLFMLVGAGVWALFWFGDAEPPEGARKWGSAAFGALFFLVGFRLFVDVFRVPRWWARRRFHGGHEPWGEGYRWNRVMPGLAPAGAGVGKGCVGVVVVGVFGVVINLFWLDPGAASGDVWLAYLLIPLFTLFILFVVGSAALEAARMALFGYGRLELESMPVAPGSQLRAVLAGKRGLPAKGRVKVSLDCIEQAASATGELGVGPAPATKIVCSVARQIDLEDGGAFGRRLPIALLLPVDAPPTALVQPGGALRYWLLTVAVPEGKGLCPAETYQFLVPVYGAI